MSTALDLLSECGAAGVELYLDTGRLRYRARAGVYTEALRQKVAAYKTELIAELAQQTAHVTPDLTHEDRCQEALPESAKARRFKVTLTSGQVLLHSRPGGLTRGEAIELSKDWGEVAECVPCPPAEISEAQKSVGDTLIEACQGTGLDPGAFRALLNDEDLADIAAGLIPVECLRAYAGRFSKRLSTPPAGALVCCADCAHFERIDHPHTGRCAAGNGRHWLWGTDKRQCEDWLAEPTGKDYP
jgi:hypothetical protein